MIHALSLLFVVVTAEPVAPPEQVTPNPVAHSVADDAIVVLGAACAGGVGACAAPFGIPGVVVAAAVPGLTAGALAVVTEHEPWVVAAAGAGATAGAIVGATAGFAVGGFGVYELQRREVIDDGGLFNTNFLLGLVGGTLVGGAVGAGSGALVGLVLSE